MNSEKVKEIKKALDCCTNPVYCEKECPYHIYERHLECINELAKDSLTYINELEEYIKGNEQDAKAFVNGWHKDLETELKQFAERLKEKLEECSPFVGFDLEDLELDGETIQGCIDETLKEFIGE